MASKAKLTKDTVDRTLPDREGSADGIVVWDTEIKGFRLRVRPTGRKTYELVYRDHYARKRLMVLGEHGKTFTADQARKRAIIERGRIAGGTNPQLLKKEQRKALTVGDLITLYLEQGPADKPDKRASSWATDKANLERHVRPLLGTQIAAELQASDISQWQAQVAAGKTAFSGPSGRPRGRLNIKGGSGAAARSIRTLSAMLAWARRRRFLAANPAETVAKLKDSREERFLSEEEAAKLWAAVGALRDEEKISAHQAAAFRLLMLTGARRNEIIGLRWSEVDFSRKLLILPPERNKAGARPKSITLPQAAVKELEKLPRSAEFVFPAASGAGHMTPPKAAWAKVLERAAIPDATFHVLRHTLASFAVADGASLYVVGRALGHSKAETTQRYAHLRDDVAAATTEAAARHYTTPKPKASRQAIAADRQAWQDKVAGDRYRFRKLLDRLGTASEAGDMPEASPELLTVLERFATQIETSDGDQGPSPAVGVGSGETEESPKKDNP